MNTPAETERQTQLAQLRELRGMILELPAESQARVHELAAEIRVTVAKGEEGTIALSLVIGELSAAS
jgi:hypothetical protein